MGIHDRDYIRQSSRSTRLARAGMTATGMLILVNVAVFFIDYALYSSGVTGPLVTGLAQGTQSGTVTAQVVRVPPLHAYGHFSTYEALSQLEFWRFVTFQFLHGGVWHLVLNMLALYFFGPLVEERIGSRRLFTAFYLTCGIFGAFLYLLLNLTGYLTGLNLPFLLDNGPFTPLVGASAGVFGVLVAAAVVAGDGMMLLFFFPVKIRTGVLILFGASLFNLFTSGPNAGGEAAHVGGAIAGYVFIKRLHLLHDFFEILGPRKGGKKGPRAPRGPTGRQRQRIDAILAKVGDRGIESLSEEERRLLAEETRRRQDG